MAAAAIAAWPRAVDGQLTRSALDMDHPAIAYRSRATDDPIAELRRRLERGEIELEYDERTGYLRALLAALQIPVESQIAVFSKTSLQAPLISPSNPRTVFFNDSVAVAWVPGGFIEIAAHDPEQGAVFYVLQQSPSRQPAFRRDDECLRCHYSLAALGVPGFLVRSIPTARDGSTLPWLGNLVTNHATALSDRWAGWFVTGRTGPTQHLGNLVLDDRRATELPSSTPRLFEDLHRQFDTSGYLSPHSDVAALLVFEHQMHMSNVLTQIGWEARIAAAEGKALSSLDQSITDAVDYMLFIDEAPLDAVQGSSGFADVFASLGPFDSEGRTLRQLGMQGRLLRYPCSYMIYSEAFERLPPSVKERLYRRLWQVLSGAVQDPRYDRLTPSDRQAVLSILTETKPDLPAYFHSAASELPRTTNR